MKKSSWKR